MDKVEEAYNQLKHELAQLPIQHSLFLIGEYEKFSSGIADTPPEGVFNFPKTIDYSKREEKTLLPLWDLQFLAREIIRNGTSGLNTSKLQNFQYLQFLINLCIKLKDDIYKISKLDILDALHPIFQQQFSSQRIDREQDYMFRYWKIFNQKEIDAICREQLGFSIQQWFDVGFAYWCFFRQKRETLPYNYHLLEGTDYEENDCKATRNALTATVTRIQNRMKSPKFGNYFMYGFNPLTYKPFVKVNGQLICPSLDFLLQRVFSGLYYDVVKHKGMENSLGKSFENYISEISAKVLPSRKYKYIKETTYTAGKQEKATVDGIIQTKHSLIFIEAKSKRMTARSKSESLQGINLKKDIVILAEAVVQLYQSLEDYEQGLYPHLAYKEDLKVYPLVVTMEDWFIMGTLTDILRKEVENQLKKKNIEISILDSRPYTIASTSEFELLLKVLKHNKAEDVFSKWHKKEHYRHLFAQYLWNTFGKSKIRNTKIHKGTISDFISFV